MKYKLLAATFAIGLASLAHSAPPPQTPSPAEMAMTKVNADILSKLNPPVQPFSRSVPVQMHSIEFKPQQLVNGETLMPFVVRNRNILTGLVTVAMEGFIRLGDQQIYLHDAKTGTDVPAAEHPRFAPVKIAKPRPSTPG